MLCSVRNNKSETFSSYKKFCSLSDYVNEYSICQHVLFNQELVEYNDSKIYNCDIEGGLPDDQPMFEFPKVAYTEINNVQVYGLSNIVQIGERFIYHDLINITKDQLPEVYFKTLFFKDTDNCKRTNEPRFIVKIDKAAIFLDACSHNYNHWIAEVLPKIFAFESVFQNNDIKYVLDETVHPNFLEALSFVVKDKSRIRMLAADESALISKCYIVSQCSYIPFQRNDDEILGHNHGCASKNALKSFVSHIVGQCKNVNLKSNALRVYIKRTSHVRSLINQDEIELGLKSLGFLIVDTSSLSFAQQVNLFRNAEIIVSPTGSACINMLFASPRAKVFILIPNFLRTSYWYWRNLLTCVGVKVNYIIGKQNASNAKHVHSDFFVNCDDLVEILRNEI